MATSKTTAKSAPKKATTKTTTKKTSAKPAVKKTTAKSTVKATTKKAATKSTVKQTANTVSKPRKSKKQINDMYNANVSILLAVAVEALILLLAYLIIMSVA